MGTRDSRTFGNAPALVYTEPRKLNPTGVVNVVTKDQIMEVLREVEDPEVHKSIVELEMVRHVEIDDNGRVQVGVALTITNCPLQAAIEKAVNEKLLALPGVTAVELELSSMNDAERAQFTAKLKGRTEPQSAPAILQPDSGIEFIAVASGKGGVGKSTITANLAVALARSGYRVGVIDADIYGFSLPAIFGVQEKRPTVIGDLIIPIDTQGVKLISMRFFVPENNPVVWRGPMLGKMLRNFFGEVHWGEVDVILIDLPPGTGDIAMDVHQLLPKSKELIVTTPHPDAADVAVRAGIMGLRTNHEILGVIENMSYVACTDCQQRMYIFGQGGGDTVARELRTEVLAQIPIHSLADAPNRLFAAGTPIGDTFDSLARRLVERADITARQTIPS